MSSDTPPPEVQRALPHDPRLWARNYLRHPNDPARAYDFWDDLGPPPEDWDEDEDGDWNGSFLYYLADDDGPMNPEKWGDINVFLFARGCLKTWTTTTVASWALDMYLSAEMVATAPVDDQRGEVIDRFKTKAEQSGMSNRRVKDNISHQKFKNTAIDEDTGESYPAYSHLKSRSAWNQGNKLRGLHAHGGIIDEAQDVDEGTFSTFLEAIDRQVPQVDYFPSVFVIGTPKLANTFFHRLWKMSDKKSWDGDAKEWVQQDEADDFLPEELQKKQSELEEEIEDIEERIEAIEDGDVEPSEDTTLADLKDLRDDLQSDYDEIEGFTVRGWHVDQHNSPIHDSRKIAFKKETYSKKKFKNEVEAKFYTPENDLITNEDIFQTAFSEESMPTSERFPQTRTVLGLDWGGGKGEGAAETVAIVAEELPEEKATDGQDNPLTIDAIEVFDNDLSSKEEREKIDDLMQQYNVDVGVVDEGFGDSDRQTLQDEFGYDTNADQTIYGCWYGSVSDKESVKWNRFEDEKRYFTTAKTFMVKKMAEDFKSGNITIPNGNLSFDSKRSNGTKVVEQLTAPYTDKNETTNGKTQEKIHSDRNDDIFDALTYAWIAANKLGTNRTLTSVGGHDMPGY